MERRLYTVVLQTVFMTAVATLGPFNKERAIEVAREMNEETTLVAKIVRRYVAVSPKKLVKAIKRDIKEG